MKKTLFILVSLMATHLHAQDVIIKQDDSTILAKVLEVDETNIKYKSIPINQVLLTPLASQTCEPSIIRMGRRRTSTMQVPPMRSTPSCIW